MITTRIICSLDDGYLVGFKGLLFCARKCGCLCLLVILLVTFGGFLP